MVDYRLVASKLSTIVLGGTAAPLHLFGCGGRSFFATDIKPHYGIEPSCGSSDSNIRANFSRQDKGGDLLLNQSCLCSQLFL
jgi:hypothetical protein